MPLIGDLWRYATMRLMKTFMRIAALAAGLFVTPMGQAADAAPSSSRPLEIVLCDDQVIFRKPKNISVRGDSSQCWGHEHDRIRSAAELVGSCWTARNM